MPERSAVSTKLQEIRKRTGLSVRDVAMALGKPQASSYYHYEGADYKKDYLPPDLVQDLVQIFGERGIDEAEIRALAEPMSGTREEPQAFQGPEITRSNAVRPFRKDFALGQPRNLPVYGRALAGTVDETEDEGWLEFNGEVLDILQRPPILDAVPDAYAVWVSGPSMEPRYFDGELAYVNPRKPVRAGHFVVAQIKPKRAGEPPRGLVKRLKAKSAGKIILVSLNPPDAPKIELPAERVISLHRIVLGGEG